MGRLLRLRNEVEGLLGRMSVLFLDPKARIIFQINNYDLMLSVIGVS